MQKRVAKAMLLNDALHEENEELRCAATARLCRSCVRCCVTSAVLALPLRVCMRVVGRLRVLRICPVLVMLQSNLTAMRCLQACLKVA